jgi:hypothetical protein
MTGPLCSTGGPNVGKMNVPLCSTGRPSVGCGLCSTGVSYTVSARRVMGYGFNR